MNEMPINELRRALRCDAEAGKLYWLPRAGNDRETKRWNTSYAGREALTAMTNKGYRNGKIHNVNYRAHRVIWALVYGEWPVDQIDHVNGIRTDNRISNLRLVSNAENQRNAKRSKRNTSGVTGVYFHKLTGKHRAYIRVNYKRIDLGYFDRFEDAVAARKAADACYKFHGNHGRKR
jgi:hypothetical protein